MGLTFVAEMNLGVLSPLSLSTVTGLITSLTADVTGLVGLTANLTATPPTFATSIVAITTLISSITAGISEGVVSVDCQIAAVLQGIVLVSAELAVPLSFQALLGGDAGIFAYGYLGTGAAMGAAFSSELASAWPNGASNLDAANALILGTLSPSVFASMRTIFGIIPPTLPNGLTYLENVNLGTLCPTFVDIISGPVAALQGQLNGLLALKAHLVANPPSFVTSLIVAAQLIATLTQAIAVGLPGVTFQIGALATQIAAIGAKLSLLGSLLSALGGPAGVFVYTYSGPGAGLGPALTTELTTQWPDGSSGTLMTNALVLGTVTPSVWATMLTFFGGA